MILYNLTKGRVVIENLKIAEKYFDRAKGLIGKAGIGKNEGLLLKRCNWIHMFFMRFAIDAVFLKTQKTQSQNVYKVVKILYNVKPWGLCQPVFSANSVLEMKAQISKDVILVGDELEVK
ncbi:MAG: DUF192 domain-containing protein [Elusimicrobia bacterium]|nr:DUF192 domain-containing protein [Elusimicrobiota bacterium]